jgi:hypothetical protein
MRQPGTILPKLLKTNKLPWFKGFLPAPRRATATMAGEWPKAQFFYAVFSNH